MMLFPLPPIDNPALQHFCAEHNLYEAVAAGYHYAQKFFLTDQIQIDFYPPYRDDEPEAAAIDFVVETCMASDEVLNTLDEFNKVMIQIPGTEYICLSPRFIAHEPS